MMVLFYPSSITSAIPIQTTPTEDNQLEIADTIIKAVAPREE